MRFCSLGSGSKGNAIYFESKETKILVDAGFSGKELIRRLSMIDVDMGEIEAIFITHDHHDHIQGLKRLANKLNIPVIANHETAKGIAAAHAECPKFKIFSTNDAFAYKDLVIQPFSVQHDTVDPVALTITVEGVKVGICTDLGFVTPLITHNLQGCDHLFVEANHHPTLVERAKRPDHYKRRVLSKLGHLSNSECGELIASIWHPNLQTVILAHLSEECNSPEIAKAMVSSLLQERGLLLSLQVAPQHEPSAIISL